MHLLSIPFLLGRLGSHYLACTKLISKFLLINNKLITLFLNSRNKLITVVLKEFDGEVNTSVMKMERRGDASKLEFIFITKKSES